MRPLLHDIGFRCEKKRAKLASDQGRGHHPVAAEIPASQARESADLLPGRDMGDGKARCLDGAG